MTTPLSQKECKTHLETVFLSDLSQVDLSRSSVFVKFPLDMKVNSGLIRDSFETKKFDAAVSFREYAVLYRFISKISSTSQISIRSREKKGNFFFVNGKGKITASLAQINDDFKDSNLSKIAKSISASIVFSGKESDFISPEKFMTEAGAGEFESLYILKEKEVLRIDPRILLHHPSASQLVSLTTPYIFRKNVPITWRSDQ